MTLYTFALVFVAFFTFAGAVARLDKWAEDRAARVEAR